jgi:hypothetical protein
METNKQSLFEENKIAFLGLSAWFGVIALAGVFYWFSTAITDIEMETKKYEDNLEFVRIQGGDFFAKQSKAEKGDSHKDVSPETLAGNDLQMTSFVAKHADAVGISVSSYKEDQLPFNPKGEGPVVMENRLKVEIRDAEMDAFVQLMDKIEKAREPVFIKQFQVRKHRKKPGQIRAVMTVSTFATKDREE